MNEFKPQAQIEVEPFDREYDLHELLPLKTLEELCRDTGFPPMRVLLCRQDGSVYFKNGVWVPAEIEALKEFIRHSAPLSAGTMQAPGSGCFAVFPLSYEMEVRGYFVIPAGQGKPDDWPVSGQVGVNILHKLMYLKHQTMMTSGLHGMVVEESYARLQEKADQLARSEEKYRRLAANLEIEVQKKAAQIKTAQAYLMQQEKLAAIGQLAAGMAHEINTPLGFMISNLNTLKGYAGDLNDLLTAYRKLAEIDTSGRTDSSGTDFKNRCRMVSELEQELDSDFLLSDMIALADETAQGAGRIHKIVSDLKRVARPGEKDRELINLTESIESVLTILANRIGEDLNIVRDYQPIPLVPGVAQEMNQVWLSLLLNAVEAMTQGGTLTIATRAAQDCAEVIIADTGCGIAEENLSRIFDPFYTTKPVGSGTGMGLHLVFQVVNQHGGRIEAASSPGRGSTFTVQLPIEGASR